MQKFKIFMMTMDCKIPKEGLKFYTGGIHTSIHPPLDFLVPRKIKKIRTFYHYKRYQGQVTQIPQEIYWHALSVHTNEASFKEIRDTIIEILREEGESRYSIEFSKHHVMRCFKQQNGITYWKTPLLY